MNEVICKKVGYFHTEGKKIKIFNSISPVQRIRFMRNRHFLYIDILIFTFTPILAMMVRHEGYFDFLRYQKEVATIICLFSFIKLVLFGFGGMYWQMWRHASVDELAKIGLLGILVVIAQTLAYSELSKTYDTLLIAIPRSIPIIDGILTMFFVGAVRFSSRLSERLIVKVNRSKGGSQVLIVGAGDAGVMIAQEMQSNPQIGLNPVGFIDDDLTKTGLKIRGIRVLGDRNAIPELANKLGIEQIIIAMPTVAGKVIREIDSICKQTGVRTRTIPGVFELLDGSVNVSKLRDIVIDDLLRREPVKIDDAVIQSQLQGKRILVTGAGGSIGGELCRQVARYNPSQLILLGHGENSIFAIANELSQYYPDIPCASVIADSRIQLRQSSSFGSSF